MNSGVDVVVVADAMGNLLQFLKLVGQLKVGNQGDERGGLGVCMCGF